MWPVCFAGPWAEAQVVTSASRAVEGREQSRKQPGRETPSQGGTLVLLFQSPCGPTGNAALGLC